MTRAQTHGPERPISRLAESVMVPVRLMEFFTQLALIFLGLFLVFLNGFFVASEFSIVKVRATRIEELVRSGSGLARRAQSVIQKMDEYRNSKLAAFIATNK